MSDDINPVSIPAGGALQYGVNDVRHYSEDDAQDVASLQNPSRMLAQRDLALASKINEVVSAVNNKEQFVPIPVLHTSMPPTTSEIVNNFRIPPGFEARVLNAAVASVPQSSDATLSILFANGFGNATGTSIVSTSGEACGGTQFYNNGEFIVVLANSGQSTLDCVGSITLTVRPIGSQASLLTGSVVAGPAGSPGPTGPPGAQGPAGAGGAGAPGMVWQGAWQSGVTYNAPTATVSYPLYGTLTSTYIAVATALSNVGNAPPNAAYWSPVAIGSSGSSTVNINYFTSGSLPLYTNVVCTGTIVPDGNCTSQGVTPVFGYGTYNAYGTVVQACQQYAMQSPTLATSPHGIAEFSAVQRVIFTGNVKVYLPQTAPEGALVNWSTSNVRCIATADGSYNTFGNPYVTIPAANQFNVTNTNSQAIQTTITLIGMQAIP